MICPEIFEMVNSQFIFIKIFFVGNKMTFIGETWYEKLHAQRLVVLSVTQHYLEKKSRDTLFMCERFSWVVVNSR